MKQQEIFRKDNRSYEDLPKVSAQSWILYDRLSNHIVAGNVQNIPHIKELLRIKRDCIINEDKASQQSGTTANLISESYMKLVDLFHGLMLPSGNDAAYCIAENTGALLYYSQKGYGDVSQIESSVLLQECDVIKKSCVKIFLKEMNLVAKEMFMNQTTFYNVHGLPHKYNKSCAYDMLKATKEALRIPIIQDIACKQKYTGLAYYNDQNHDIQWENTNKLLHYSGYKGLKTGFTIPAGFCLSSWYQSIDNWSLNKNDFIIIVLGCQSCILRQLDTQNIVDWYIQKKREFLQ